MTLSNVDDIETLYLNGQEIGSVGYGGTQSFDLGDVSDSARIYVDVYNADGGYSWSIDERRAGTRVFHDEAGSIGEYGANSNDQDHTNQVVHWVRLDPSGNLIDSYTVGS